MGEITGQVTYTSYYHNYPQYFWYQYPYGDIIPQPFIYCPYCGKKLEPHICIQEIKEV